jgi:hypothetical protein
MDLEEACTLDPLGEGRFGVDLRVEFAIGGNKPNGGYLLACLGRAAVAAARDAGASQEHPVATGVQYSVSPDLGPGVIETEVHRVGRTASQVSAGLGGVSARFTLGTLREDGQPYWGAIAPVELPPLDECARMTSTMPRPDNGTELFFDPDAMLRFTEEGPTGTGDGELRAWFRFADGRTITPLDLLYVVDAMPPASFSIVSTGWVPTLDLSVYVRALPAPGPLRIRFRVQVIQEGFADEVCEVWDTTGRLVAQSTQLTALRLPPATA